MELLPVYVERVQGLKLLPRSITGSNTGPLRNQSLDEYCDEINVLTTCKKDLALDDVAVVKFEKLLTQLLRLVKDGNLISRKYPKVAHFDPEKPNTPAQ